MKIFDGHSDILNDIATKRMSNERNVFRKHHHWKFKEGGIKATNFVIWVEPENYDKYELRQNEIIESFVEEMNEDDCPLHLVTKFRDFKSAEDLEKIAVILGLEGMDSVTSTEHVDYFYRKGVRQASLTWNGQNSLATGVSGPADSGISRLGKTIVNYMQDKRILLDVSHLNENSFWDIIAISKSPIVASHSNCYTLCNHPRNLKDAQIKEIARHDGVIGINAWPDFIDDSNPSVQKMVDHITHISNLVGHQHVSFGFDFCDFFGDTVLSDLNGQSHETTDMEDASKVGNLIREMEKIGFHYDEIKDIAFNNLALRYEMSLGSENKR